MSRIKKIFILIILLIITSCILYFVSEKVKNVNYINSLRTNSTDESLVDTNNSKVSNINEVIFTKFFIPVVGIKSFINNLNPNENTKKILVIKDEYNDIIKIQALEKFNFDIKENLNEFVDHLNKNLEEIGITSFENLNLKIKLISWDQKYILNKNLNLNNYDLKINIKLITKGKNNLNTSNFDQNKIISIGHTGSLIPARGVDFYIRTRFNYDFKNLFKHTKPLFESIDFVSSTFEAPVLKEGVYCSNCTKFIGPVRFMEAVDYSGLDLFSLASNHIMDGGLEGLKSTQEELDKIGKLYVGASITNNDEAGKPLLVDLKGLKIAYIGLNDTPGKEQWAEDNKGGAANVSDWIIDERGNTTKYEPNVGRIKYFLNRAKKLNPDLIIVIIHWGSVEYTSQPTVYNRNLAKLLIENGADIIFGDHPHWVQEIEYINSKPVFYSVGNFVFDQTWSIETMQGITIELFLYDKKIINYRLHPHQLDLPQNGTIRLLNDEEKEYRQTLQRIYKVSNNLK